MPCCAIMHCTLITQMWAIRHHTGQQGKPQYATTVLRVAAGPPLRPSRSSWPSSAAPSATTRAQVAPPWRASGRSQRHPLWSRLGRHWLLTEGRALNRRASRGTASGCFAPTRSRTRLAATLPTRLRPRPHRPRCLLRLDAPWQGCEPHPGGSKGAAREPASAAVRGPPPGPLLEPELLSPPLAEAPRPGRGDGKGQCQGVKADGSGQTGARCIVETLGAGSSWRALFHAPLALGLEPCVQLGPESAVAALFLSC